MKFLLLLAVLLTGVRCAPPPTIVYVCDSPNAIRYHLRADCRGLSNCSHRIIKITLEEAKRSGKTLCHWEQ